MMRYILDSRYRLRGWHGAPAGVYDTKAHTAHFIAPSLYKLLLRCDAVQEINDNDLTEAELLFLRKMEEEKVIRPAGIWDFLLPQQRYHAYPSRYRKNVHWSVTGACTAGTRIHCGIRFVFLLPSVLRV